MIHDMIKYMVYHIISYLAVSRNWGLLFVFVLSIRELLFGVCSSATRDS